MASDHCWRPPASGFKLNVDAAVDVRKDRHNVAAVIRDCNGLSVDVVAKCFEGLVDVEVAEVKAILEGLQLAIEDDLCELIMEFDAFKVIKLCTGEIVSRSEVVNVIHDIHLLVDKHGFSSFFFVPHKCNKVAHGATRWVVSSGFSALWILSFPD
ncbi:hypothetical protein ACOSQ2_002706 [Xanthoceras sorbifolium]